MSTSIRLSTVEDVNVISEVLIESSLWLEERGIPLWSQQELQPDLIASDTAAGRYFLAERSAHVIAVARFQLEDPEFWPDRQAQEATFIHRLAVRRSVAGGEVSSAMLRWAVDRTRLLGRRYLRLDCDASRPRLRAVYERFGFRHHSDKQVGRYFVSLYEYEV